MTGAQNQLHWRLWGQLRRADPAADRKAVYRQLGLPESHVEWSNRHLDTFKAHVLSVTQPANFGAQMRQEQQPETRRRHTIDLLIAALELTEPYVDAIVAKQCHGRWVSYSQMPESAMGNLFIALKKQARRAIPTKADLLTHIDTLCRENDLDEQAAREAAHRALSRPLTKPIKSLTYDDLILILGALRALIPF